MRTGTTSPANPDRRIGQDDCWEEQTENTDKNKEDPHLFELNIDHDHSVRRRTLGDYIMPAGYLHVRDMQMIRILVAAIVACFVLIVHALKPGTSPDADRVKPRGWLSCLPAVMEGRLFFIGLSRSETIPLVVPKISAGNQQIEK